MTLETADIEQLEGFIADHRLDAAKEMINRLPPSDVAAYLTELRPVERGVAFRLLSKDRAIEVFEELDPREQQELLEQLHAEQVIHLISEMSPDDRAALLDEVPAKVAKRLLAQLSPAEREATSVLLGYAPGTAGRIMTPRYISLRESATVAQALEKIRRVGADSETVYTAYVTDQGRKLLGVVELRDLVLSEPERLVGNLMDREIISVRTDTDQEEVARVVRDHDLLAAPVVDHEGRLVGIVTVDDILDIVEEETSEDLQRLAAVASGPTGAEERYFGLGLGWRLARRLPWLAALALAGALSGSLIQLYEEVLGAVLALSFFIPMVLGTAGNTGSQSVTLAVRALATGEVSPRRFWRTVLKEVATGAALGCLLGVVAFVIAYLRTAELLLALSVGMAMAASVLVIGVVGVILPYVLWRLNLDPAVASSPLIATLGDSVGLLLYFNVARFLLYLR